jgi:D-3-phosphoglycerate dehydrogenase
MRITRNPHAALTYLEEERRAMAGLDVEIVPIAAATQEQLIADAREADALITVGVPITRRALDGMPKCRMIVTASVGYDAIDVEAATAVGVPVAHVPDFCTHEVANHTIMLLLAVTRKLIPLHNNLRAGKWDRSFLAGIPPLHGQTLGLIGFGRIGRAVATRARGFAMQVIAADPYVDRAVMAEHGARWVQLEDLLRQADCVSVHCLLNAKTRHLIGEREFRLMKPTAFFFNTARGKVVDEQALITALRERWIAGAGIDVFEQEPTEPANALLQFENVVITPHTAGHSDVSIVEARRGAAAEVARVLRGYWPKNLVNPEVRANPRFPLMD